MTELNALLRSQSTVPAEAETAELPDSTILILIDILLADAERYDSSLEL